VTAGAKDALRLGAVIGALGVVFGDIGTSPIYTLQTVFDPDDPHPVAVAPSAVVGIVSLIVWSVVLIVTVTYVSLAMRVDNHGEGGIMALITLLRRWGASGRRGGRRTALVLASLGVLGAALFLGDSMITPAISVLSAVEGLKVIRPGFSDAVVPITAVIILLLFLAQRFGTAVVGRIFGPVMILWFATLAALGLRGISIHPTILRALSPTYAVQYVTGHFEVAFFALAAVVLSVTGAEALYADMGHFGRRPISVGWLFFVFPSLALTYLGQGALILQNPAHAEAPFFLLAPHALRIPLVLLATAATVIAAQAVITGAFSVAAQAAQLGYLPRLRVVHTSGKTYGQIYVPWINWLLATSVLTLVFAFRSSTSLAYAYGIAVTGTITITTILFFYIARRTWHGPAWLLLFGATVLIGVDLLFFAANATKFLHGGWLPLVIAITAFSVMVTWQRGRALITARRVELEGPLQSFVDDLRAMRGVTSVVPGTAIFLNRGRHTAPLALRANVTHNHVRHQRVVIASVEVDIVPRVPEAERLLVDHLGDPRDGITHIAIRFGYMEPPDVPRALTLLTPEQTEGEINLDDATYFLSTIELQMSRVPGLATWRKRLFIATSHITADAADHFSLPRDRTVLLGSHVEV
jgi:KUP system potassium uptake protein